MSVRSMRLGSLALLFCLALRASAECDVGTDQACELDSATLLQVTTQKSVVNDLNEEIALEGKRSQWCWFWDKKCIKKVHAQWAKAKKICSTGAEQGPVTEGVHTNGSIHIENMMKSMETNANNVATCLKKNHGHSKDIRTAQFKASTIIRIVKMMGPGVQAQLAKADLGLTSLVQKGSGSIANLSAKGIQTIDWLEYVLRSKVELAVNKEIKNISTSLLAAVWRVAGKIETSIEGMLVEGLGLIPVVGATLAESASKTVTEVYHRLKEGVNNAIYNLLDKIANETVGAIVNEACKALDAVKKGIQNVTDLVITSADKLEHAGSTIAHAIGNATQSEYQQQAEEGKKDGDGHLNSIISDGHTYAKITAEDKKSKKIS